MITLPTINGFPTITVDRLEYIRPTSYNAQHWLRVIRERIENSPFKGYLEVRLNLSGVPYLMSIVSPLRWDRRQRAFSHVFEEINDLEHQAWLAHKHSKTYTYF